MLECQNKKLIEEASNALEALTLANNFLFQKVMQNEELCVKVLSRLNRYGFTGKGEHL